MLKPTTLALFCSFAFACGGSSSDSGMLPTTTDFDASVWSPAVQTLVVEDSGSGFAPQPPPGSTCTVNAKQFTLTTATKNLSWMRCVGSSSTPYQWVAGSRALTAAEYSALDPVLSNLKVAMPANGCIADAGILTVTVSTASGQQQYVDADEQCTIKDKPYIARDAIAAAIDQLNSLAGS